MGPYAELGWQEVRGHKPSRGAVDTRLQAELKEGVFTQETLQNSVNASSI